RWISTIAASASNQWNACATVTASTDPATSGIDSAVPSSTETSGSARSSAARIAATGSTATTSAPPSTRSRVSFPVPAARSRMRAAGPSPSSAARYAIASSGYDGRPRSYASAELPNPAVAVGCIDTRKRVRRLGRHGKAAPLMRGAGGLFERGLQRQLRPLGPLDRGHLAPDPVAAVVRIGDVQDAG